jgi:hypothetical protein
MQPAAAPRTCPPPRARFSASFSHRKDLRESSIAVGKQRPCASAVFALHSSPSLHAHIRLLADEMDSNRMQRADPSPLTVSARSYLPLPLAMILVRSTGARPTETAGGPPAQAGRSVQGKDPRIPRSTASSPRKYIPAKGKAGFEYRSMVSGGGKRIAIWMRMRQVKTRPARYEVAQCIRIASKG